MQPLIHLKNLTKIYLPQGKQDSSLGVRALDGINLDIHAGEYVAIVGPSGSGKSTLMQIIGLLDRPTSGKFLLAGEDISALSDDQLALLRNSRIGFIFQFFNLLARTSALDNVALPLIYGRHKDAAGHAKALLKKVGLGDRLYHAPHQLSGGQQQRVAIARALANSPVLLFADEPTGNISSAQAEEVMAELDGLNRQGVTVIVVTHEPDIAAHARRVLTLKDGHIISDKVNRHGTGKKAGGQDSGHFRIPSIPALPSLDSFKENLRMALVALSLNKVRTALTMLGVLCGVAAVIATTAIGNGSKEAVRKQLESLGSNLIVVSPGSQNARGTGSAPRFQMPDVDRVKQLSNAGGAVSKVDPTCRGSVLVSYGDNDWSTSMTGCEPRYETMRACKPIVGRFFTDDEDAARARVCLLGRTVITNLYPPGFDPTGSQVKINKTNYTVIGVLPVKGANGFQDQDDVVLCPLQTAMFRVFGLTTLSSIDVEAKDADSVAPCIDEVTQLLRVIRHIQKGQADDFNIRNMADIQAVRQSSMDTIATTIFVTAIVSLIVGGIGIMNILLVSVRERTKEIGLRKALGARNVEVLFQFLVEAVLLSLIGGLAGIMMGNLFAVGVSLWMGWGVLLPWGTVFLAVAVSALVGIGAGMWPALQASKLSPIEALRYE